MHPTIAAPINDESIARALRTEILNMIKAKRIISRRSIIMSHLFIP
jgi:hypothetical protein